MVWVYVLTECIVLLCFWFVFVMMVKNTCPCGPVVKVLGRHVQYSVTCSVASAWVYPLTKELFLIIPMHLMNRELILGHEEEGSTVSSINYDCC